MRLLRARREKNEQLTRESASNYQGSLAATERFFHRARFYDYKTSQFWSQCAGSGRTSEATTSGSVRHGRRGVSEGKFYGPTLGSPSVWTEILHLPVVGLPVRRPTKLGVWHGYETIAQKGAARHNPTQMDTNNLKNILLALASCCQQSLSSQDFVFTLLARDVDGISPSAQQGAQQLIDHNQKLRELLRDVGGMIARI